MVEVAAVVVAGQLVLAVLAVLAVLL